MSLFRHRRRRQRLFSPSPVFRLPSSIVFSLFSHPDVQPPIKILHRGILRYSMSCPVKPRKRINPGRSKNGCLTCREKRKKCDERQPICARCERLRLVCQPCDRDTRPSLKERRRGRGSYKALNHSSWTAPPLLPAPSVSGILSRSSTPSVTLSNFSLPTTSIPEGLASEQDQHDEGTHMMYPTASDLGHPLGGGIMPFSLPFDSSSSSSSIFESCSGEASVDHHRGSNLDLILPQHIPLDDDGDYSTVIGPVSTPDRHNIIQSLFQSISQIPTNPFTFHTLASGVVLTKRDHHALVHYQTVFAHTQTLKNPKWSFPSLLLQTTSHSSMSFHMALAVSHQDFGLHNSSPAAQGCREDASFHFSVGLQSFQATMADAHTYSDQIAIMTTLYYMYIYLTNQEPRDAKKIARLSQVTLNYVIKYSLDFNLESGSPPASLQGGLANRPTDPATKALLARLLFWLYKEDVWSGFLGCGGRLASYFRMSQNKIKDIWKTSKSVLELNWGSSYPNDETVIDMEFSDVVDMNVYCVELQHQITEYYRAVVVDTGLREFRRLEESLNALETVSYLFTKINTLSTITYHNI